MAIQPIPTLAEIVEKFDAFREYADAKQGTGYQYQGLVHDYSAAASILTHINYRITIGGEAGIEALFDSMMFLLNFRTRIEYSYDHLTSYDDYKVDFGSGGTGGAVKWTDISGKPTTYPPSTHEHSFDWNRAIKSSEFLGRNIFTESGDIANSVKEGLETLLFPRVSPTITAGAGSLFEEGTSQDFMINGTLSPNDGDTIGSFELIDSNDNVITSFPPNAAPASTSISHEVTGIVTNMSYRFKAVVDGLTVYSPYVNLSFVPAVLFGVNAGSNIQGTDAYQGLSKVIEADKSLTVEMNGTNGYMYLFIPLSFGIITSIQDQNGFELRSFLESQTQISVTTLGLDDNQVNQYYRYRSPFQGAVNQIQISTQ